MPDAGAGEAANQSPAHRPAPVAPSPPPVISLPLRQRPRAAPGYSRTGTTTASGRATSNRAVHAHRWRSEGVPRVCCAAPAAAAGSARACGRRERGA
jgi:hypothetical protein